MNVVQKGIVGVVGVLVVLILGFYVFIRIYVGGVNVPFGEVQVDPAKLTERIVVPEGFSIGVYAANLPKARLLRFTDEGDLLVAIPNENKIVLLGRDADGDGQADDARVLMRDLNGPNGMDFDGDFLYIAEQDAIGRVRFDHGAGETVGDYERIVTGLSGGENHWKKTLRVGPDEKLYVTMGSSCNVCIEADERRATMVRYNLDGTGEAIFAKGLRNSAGFDWRPEDGMIYATDNGRDMLGDDFPPCELNRVVEGAHYGWPYANGNRVPDPDFGDGKDALIASSIPPVHDFRPHNAPLGIEFVRGSAFPEDYQGAAIVALHGSWNRSDKDGYKVVSLHFDDDGAVTERDFVSGFLKDGDVIGRPAEVTEGPDGAFYISDDYAGAVYRVAYGEAQTFVMPTVALKEYDPIETLGQFSAKERQALVSQGQEIFAGAPCLGCHTAGLSGAKKFDGIGYRHNVETLSAFLEKPTPPMPMFPFSAEEKKALSVYLIETYP